MLRSRLNIIIIFKIVTLTTVLSFPSSGSDNITEYYNENDQKSEVGSYAWKPLIEIDSDSFQKAILPSYIEWNSEIFQNKHISEACRKSLMNAWNDVRYRKTWAVKLFDSWAKFPPSGSWIGTLTDFGSYDQCLSIDRPVQYCLIDSKIPMPKMPRWNNLYDQLNVFPDYESMKSNNLNIPEDNLFYSLANISSIFYYVFVQTGVCLPYECSAEKDIKAISQSCKLYIFLYISIYKYRFFS